MQEGGGAKADREEVAGQCDGGAQPDEGLHRQR